MSFEVDTFSYFSSGNGKENSSPTDVTCFAIVPQTLLSLDWVFLLDVDILIFYELVDHLALFPVLKNMLHVDVRWKEAKDSIRYYFTQSSQQLTICVGHFQIASCCILRT